MRSLCLWLMLSFGGCQLRVSSNPALSTPPSPLLSFTSVFFQGIFSCMGDKSALFLSDAISYLAVASYPGGNVCICMAAKGGLERES